MMPYKKISIKKIHYKNRLAITLGIFLINAAHADGFYLGGTLGKAQGDVGAAEMNKRMADLGYDANAKVSGQDRSAWRVFGGYEYSGYLRLEAGYVDLGRVRTRLSGTTLDIQRYLTDANRVHPRSASGYELAIVGRHPFNDEHSVYLRGGFLFADSQYRARSQSNSAKRTEDDREGFIGVGYAYNFDPKWELRLSYDQYRVEGERIGLLGLGVTYYFHEQ